jgi:hypothetical protein
VVVEITPKKFIRCIDFQYILNAIIVDEAISILKIIDDIKTNKIWDAKNSRAVAAYLTQASWLGFLDKKIVRKMQSILEEGFDKFKLKVEGNL